MEVNKKINKNNISPYFIEGCILGMLVFIALHGIKILNVTYTDWLLMQTGDLSQHYLGWEFFRQSEWSFPVIGTIKELVYPYDSSIVFFDSIPILAVLCKVINPILPADFQYFGLWGLLSFALQVGIAALIIKDFEKDYVLVGMYTILITLCPALIDRMYIHTALASHWVILLGIWIWRNRSRFSFKSEIKIWTMTCCLSIAIHPYLTLMTGIILLGYLIDNYIEKRNIKQELIVLISSVTMTGLVFYLLGGFVMGSNGEQGGLGMYSMNLNALFNPQGYSALLKDLPSNYGQYEGLQYLGVGIILLGMYCIGYYIINTQIKENKLLNECFKWTKNHLGGVIVVIICLFLSASPVITINDKILLDYSKYLPEFVTKLWSTFRATGRLFWPVLYMTIIAIFIFASTKLVSKRAKYVIVGAAFCFQLIDLSTMIIDRNQYFNEGYYYENALSSKFWDDIGSEQQVKHLQMLPIDITWWKGISYYALKYDMTVSMTYLARMPQEQMQEIVEECFENLNNGKAALDTMYIIQDVDTFNKIMVSEESGGLSYLVVDNMMVILNSSLVDLERYAEEDGILAKGIIGQDERILLGKENEMIFKIEKSAEADKHSYDVEIMPVQENYYFEGQHIQEIEVEIKNNTANYFSSRYTSDATYIAYHVFDAEGHLIEPEGVRTGIEIAPYSTSRVKMKVILPDAGGKYKIKVDMVTEGVTWFEAQGAQTATVDVEYVQK